MNPLFGRAKRLAFALALVLLCSVSSVGFALLEERTDSLVNTFNPQRMIETTDSVQIDVLKTVRTAGTDTISPEGFTFELVGADGSLLTAVSGADGAARFELRYGVGDVGTHTYTLRERDDGRPGVTYDTRSYTVRVEVSYQNEALTASMQIDGVQGAVTFENSYTALTGGLPFTGDTSNLLLYAALLAIGLLGLVCTRRAACLRG